MITFRNTLFFRSIRFYLNGKKAFDTHMMWTCLAYRSKRISILFSSLKSQSLKQFAKLLFMVILYFLLFFSFWSQYLHSQDYRWWSKIEYDSPTLIHLIFNDLDCPSVEIWILMTWFYNSVCQWFSWRYLTMLPMNELHLLLYYKLSDLIKCFF
jgi:hypothetical protein